MNINQYVRIATITSFITHGTLIAGGYYRSSYDAYVHMFFADHYRVNWWSLWEPRWYAGFSVASYPPLVHQVIALISFLVGVEAAWAITFLTVLVLLPAGVYTFARLFVNPLPAGYAALLTPLLPSIYLTGHVFGQLPTLAGLLGVFYCLSALNEYLTTGKWIYAALAITLTACVIASHHGTMLFMPWAILAVGLHVVVAKKVQLSHLIYRAFTYGVFTLPASLVVIWPFWQWSLHQTMQTPIDHASRHNFLNDPIAAFMFFWPMYGVLPLIILWMIKEMRHRKRLVPGGLFLIMFVLGLGGTTPLPKMLFGRGWEWLTYDRFALWASICMLPFVGLLATVVRYKFRRNTRFWKITQITLVELLGFTIFLVLWIPKLYPLQPPRVDMHPIVNFLNENHRSEWRYLTFGFGDQMALLSRLTGATSIDGSSHTSRDIPELRNSGIGQIDTAFWLPYGMKSLDTILSRASSYGVRWGFVNLSVYDKLLTLHGWRQIGTLENGVEVWENPAAIISDLDQTTMHEILLADISWGVLPLMSLLVCIVIFLKISNF